MYKKVLEKLKSAGLKKTAVREAILFIFCSIKSPLSAVELMEILNKRGLQPNKTTIYRELELLTNNEFINEITVGDAVLRYEINTNQHQHHFVCHDCGRIETIQVEEDLEKLESKLVKEKGINIQGHNLTFFGECTDCCK